MKDKYTVTFTGQTSDTAKLSEKAIWIVSIPFAMTEERLPEYVEQLRAFAHRMKTAAIAFDILLTGELNAYNFRAIGQSEEDALNSAIKLEKDWESKYLSVITGLVNQEEQLNFTTLATDPIFSSSFKFVKHLYDENNNFSDKVTPTVGNRIAQMPPKGIKTRFPDARTVKPEIMLPLFTEYVLKECALVLQLRTMGYDSVFYMGKINPSTEYITKFNLNTIAEDAGNIHFSDAPVLKPYHNPSFRIPPKVTTKIVTADSMMRFFEQGHSTHPKKPSAHGLSQTYPGALPVEYWLFRAYFDSKEVSESSKLQAVLQRHPISPPHGSTPEYGDSTGSPRSPQMGPLTRSMSVDAIGHSGPSTK